MKIAKNSSHDVPLSRYSHNALIAQSCLHGLENSYEREKKIKEKRKLRIILIHEATGEAVPPSSTRITVLDFNKRFPGQSHIHRRHSGCGGVSPGSCQDDA